MLPSEVLVTPTVATAEDQFGNARAPPARKVPTDLRVFMIRSFGRGIIEQTFCSALVAASRFVAPSYVHDLPTAPASLPSLDYSAMT